jgi:hypothetical protein
MRIWKTAETYGIAWPDLTYIFGLVWIHDECVTEREKGERQISKYSCPRWEEHTVQHRENKVGTKKSRRIYVNSWDRQKGMVELHGQYRWLLLQLQRRQ